MQKIQPDHSYMLNVTMRYTILGGCLIHAMLAYFRERRLTYITQDASWPHWLIKYTELAFKPVLILLFIATLASIIQTVKIFIEGKYSSKNQRLELVSFFILGQIALFATAIYTIIY